MLIIPHGICYYWKGYPRGQRAAASAYRCFVQAPSAYTHHIQENCADSTHAKLNIYPRHRLDRLSVNDYKTGLASKSLQSLIHCGCLVFLPICLSFFPQPQTRGPENRRAGNELCYQVCKPVTCSSCKQFIQSRSQYEEPFILLLFFFWKNPTRV